MNRRQSSLRAIGFRFRTALGSIVQLAARDEKAYHFVEWGPGLPARRCRVRRDRLWDLLEGATLLGTEAEA